MSGRDMKKDEMKIKKMPDVNVEETLLLKTEDSERLEEGGFLLDAADAEELEEEGFFVDEGGTEEEFLLEVEDAEELEEEILLNAEDAQELESCFLEESLSQEEKKEKEERDGKRRKVLKIVLGLVAGVFLVVYLCGTFFFTWHFQFRTTINGTDFAFMNAKDAQSYMEEQVERYALEIKKSDGSSETIEGSDISLVYKQGNDIKNLLKEQKALLWPLSIWKAPEITASIGVEYDENQLSNQIAGLELMKDENQIPPVSAYPEFDGTQFVVKPEEKGRQIDQVVFEKKVKEHINGFRDTLDLDEEGCYLKPVYVQDSPEVLAACQEMNDQLGASVTYTFGSATEVVDGALISQWLTTDENMAVTFHQDAVEQYIKDLASKYNTYGDRRTFTAGNGNTVNVEGGDYGWVIDRNAEYEALINHIKNKEVVTKEPAYSQRAVSHDGVDWGNTYVEIDLTNQYLYLFVKGSLVVSGPVVTGKPSEGNATPQGVYAITYCTKNATLRGPKQPDGSYEWESPVSFWMPFNGAIGLHDASWQAAFGGDRYLTHGSRGCVNLQYSVAEKVYNNVQAGTPVICHY